MKTEIVYSEIFNQHDIEDHPENAKRTSIMMDALLHSELYDQVNIVKPIILPEESLYSIHNDEMIFLIKTMSKEQESWIDLDTYVCKNDFETARFAAGGLVQISRDVISGKADNGFALIRPPGHHATKTRSMGFCLFNNVSLAAMDLVKKGKRVVIVDSDVHHGNGTQEIFYNNDKVLYQSFHLSPHYPGSGSIDEIGENEGRGYTVNAPLPRRTSEYFVQRLLDEVFKPIAKQFKPDIILVSSGFDSHYADRLGGLHLEIDFFGDLICQYQKIQKKIVLTIEGGYNLDILGKCFLSQISYLCNKPLYFDDSIPPSIEPFHVIKTLKKELESYWDL